MLRPTLPVVTNRSGRIVGDAGRGRLLQAPVRQALVTISTPTSSTLRRRLREHYGRIPVDPPDERHLLGTGRGGIAESMDWLGVSVGVFGSLGRGLAAILNRPGRFEAGPAPASPPDEWQRLIRPGDVLLVEGCTRIGTAIKYLTQSTWSHSALYVGDRCPHGPLIEADVSEGVIASPVEKYRDANTRICRPVGLSGDDLNRVLDFAIARLGNRYDLRNIFDLARYLFPTPPVPPRWRRRLLTLGSGEPTKAICSSLVAQAFQQVHYPILPYAVWSSEDPADRHLRFQIRHYSLFTPRDFDLSPYFDIVKPELRVCFDYRALPWID